MDPTNESTITPLATGQPAGRRGRTRPVEDFSGDNGDGTSPTQGVPDALERLNLNPVERSEQQLSELRHAGSGFSPNHDGDLLDVEHHARVTRVSACDSARARKAAAEAEIARLVEEEQILRAELQALGGNEHVDAIMRSGWFPYADPILASARLAWILDAVLWTALWLGIWVLAYRAFGHE